jgi:hypothetical protein
MSNTLRKVIEFPKYMRELSAKVDPLDSELEAIRAINWELNKLQDEDAVIRCITFVMEHRGFELRNKQETEQ